MGFWSTLGDVAEGAANVSTLGGYGLAKGVLSSHPASGGGTGTAGANMRARQHPPPVDMGGQGFRQGYQGGPGNQMAPWGGAQMPPPAYNQGMGFGQQLTQAGLGFGQGQAHPYGGGFGSFGGPQGYPMGGGMMPYQGPGMGYGYGPQAHFGGMQQGGWAGQMSQGGGVGGMMGQATNGPQPGTIYPGPQQSQPGQMPPQSAASRHLLGG